MLRRLALIVRNPNCEHALTMDSEVRKLAMLLMFQFSVLCTFESLSNDFNVISVWPWQQVCCMMIAMQGLVGVRPSRPRRLWAYDRGLGEPGFFDRNLLGSFNPREFKAHLRMDISTFEYLCSTLAPALLKQNTNMLSAILVQVKVVVAISRLATSNSMQTIADLYRMGLSTSQLAVTQFTGAIKTILLQKFIRWPSTSTMEQFAREFENLHQIPYMVGAVDGSHIPIVAPRFHAADYYKNRTEKDFTQYYYRVLCLASVCFGTLT